MAQFKADIRGGRGQTSRLGHKTSGIWAWIRGWSSGVEVRGRFNELKEEDECRIYLTGGSGSSHAKYIGKVTEAGRFVASPDAWKD